MFTASLPSSLAAGAINYQRSKKFADFAVYCVVNKTLISHAKETTQKSVYGDAKKVSHTNKLTSIKLM